MSDGLYPVPMARKGPPRYQVIADDLRTRVEAGDIPPGSDFPPGHELEQHYKAADGTIKRAFDVLVESGWAESTQGKVRTARMPGPADPVASLGEMAELRDRVNRLEGRMTASERYDMDVARVLAEAGLDVPEPPQPPPGEGGPLGGIWLSEYRYPSSSGGEFTSRHYMVLHQHGAAVTVRSVAASASQLSVNLTINGRVATGSWTERTDPGGRYEGAVYHGAIQLLLSDEGQRLEGKWAGFGSQGEVNSGPWSLTLVDADAGALERWNRVPEAAE